MPMKLSAKLISALVCLLIAGCTGLRPVEFPDADIVYQAGSPNDPKIGFVNADGSNVVVLPVDSYLTKPHWSADGKTLYVIQWSGMGANYGRVSVWQQGEAMHVCQNHYWQATDSIVAIIPQPDSLQAIINNAEVQLLLIDLNRCEEIRRYIDLTDSHSYIIGASLSSDGKHLLYGEESDRRLISPKYTIKSLDINSGETIDIGDGVNPVWSPDNKWIAYVRLDGIYVMAPDGAQKRLLVEYDAVDGYEGSRFAAREPTPRWSPDGKWLVYQKCMRYQVDCSIFKVEVATGAESKLVDKGDYPFWRSR